MSYCRLFLHKLLVRMAKAGGIIEDKIEEGHLVEISRDICDDKVDIAQISTV